MIKVDQISYHYKKDNPIFKDISLAISPGEIVGMYGNSGLGKTTLAKIIAGYISPKSGSVNVDDKNYPFKGRNPVQLIWQHPEFAVNPRWRLRKVMAEMGGLDQKVLDKLEIKNSWLQRYPSELSGGELQRFCVARALHPNTKYIIADEMTTMLDALTQVRIWKVLKDVVLKRGLGVLAISHNLELLKKISSRTINFNDMVVPTKKN